MPTPKLTDADLKQTAKLFYDKWQVDKKGAAAGGFNYATFSSRAECQRPGLHYRFGRIRPSQNPESCRSHSCCKAELSNTATEVKARRNKKGFGYW